MLSWWNLRAELSQFSSGFSSFFVHRSSFILSQSTLRLYPSLPHPHHDMTMFAQSFYNFLHSLIICERFLRCRLLSCWRITSHHNTRRRRLATCVYVATMFTKGKYIVKTIQPPQTAKREWKSNNKQHETILTIDVKVKHIPGDLRMMFWYLCQTMQTTPSQLCRDFQVSTQPELERTNEKQPKKQRRTLKTFPSNFRAVSSLLLRRCGDKHKLALLRFPTVHTLLPNFSVHVKAQQ